MNDDRLQTFDERVEGAWATLNSGGTRNDAALDFDLPYFYVQAMITVQETLTKRHVVTAKYKWKEIERMVNTSIMVSGAPFS